MSKFVIACPVCHQYVQASTGLFASRPRPLRVRQYH